MRKVRGKWSLGALVFLLSASLAAPAWAGGRHHHFIGEDVDAVLYEVAEEAVIEGKSTAFTFDPTVPVPDPPRRDATAALTGWAELGTVLCPNEMLVVYPKAKRCAVNAVGFDAISLISGQGPVFGQFFVVLNLDNPVDGPEIVVAQGQFQGAGDLSPALLGTPLGSISGGTGSVTYFFTPTPLTVNFVFDGTFRLPFSVDKHGGMAAAWVKRPAFYLSDAGKKILVRRGERSIDWPTVRLEIKNLLPAP